MEPDTKTPRAEAIAAFIAARLPVGAAPSVPEIRLHLAGPASGLWRLAQDDEDFASPYWAHVWGGGQALARHLLEHQEVVAGRSVLDLGCGGGIVAIAAAMRGAARVTAADVDRHAVVATGLNAALNGVAVETVLGDLTTGPATEAQVVLVGDLFYDAELAIRVAGFLDRCVAAGATVLVGDPWRAFLPQDRMTLLADHPVSDFGTGGEPRPAAVFAWG